MELLGMLFILLMIFVVLPGLAIAGIVYIIYRKFFKKDKENVETVSSNIVQEDSNVNSQVVRDYVKDILGKEFGSFAIVRTQKVGSNTIKVGAHIIELFDEQFYLSSEFKEKYLEYIVDNNLMEKIVETDERNSFAVRSMVKELNNGIVNSIANDVVINGSLLIQEDYREYVPNYNGEAGVDRIAVMIEVDDTQIFTEEDFADLKQVFVETLEERD